MIVRPRHRPTKKQLSIAFAGICCFDSLSVIRPPFEIRVLRELINDERMADPTQGESKAKKRRLKNISKLYNRMSTRLIR
jgi:hypothetical protein